MIGTTYIERKWMNIGNGGKIMPTYTLKDLKTNQEWDVVCSYEDLQKTLDEMPNVKQVLKAPQIVGGRMGNSDLKVPDGFKDLKKRIKAGSGRNNKIDI